MSNEFYHSKSKYVKFMNCNKRLWLEKYKSEYMEEVLNEDRLAIGNQIGDLAMGLFGDYYLAETNPIDILKQIENTKSALIRKERVICEASFLVGNNYCAVDILKLEDDGSYSINEVKSSTSSKDYYIYDLAYQYYVLTAYGLNISKVNLIYINNKYVFENKLDINEYFSILDLTNKIIEESKNVFINVELSNKILNSNTEPNVDLSSSCTEYNGCPFKNYCYKLKGLPEKNSIMTLYNCKTRLKYVKNGILSFDDLIKNNIALKGIPKMQVEFALRRNDNDIYIDKKAISEFLKDFKYPLYFFDFESFQAIIPEYNGVKPYQQIVFQYSLHIMHEDGRCEHKEFLGDGKSDPRLSLLLQMLADLGESGTIIAYNTSFETSRIKELAIAYPEYSNKLLALNERFIDLAKIFQSGYLYNKAMGGSFSIKSVLPALFPNDESLNYKSLKQIHKGDEASNAYLELKNMNEDDYNKTRYNLLKYCELDTYAMVKIYEKILELIK